MTATPEVDLSSAAFAVEMWARSKGIYGNNAARLSGEVPFPSSLFLGLDSGDVAASGTLRQLIADLEGLAVLWEAWEAEHVDRHAG